MSRLSWTTNSRLFVFCCVAALGSQVAAQQIPQPAIAALEYQVQSGDQRLEMQIDGSKILTLKDKSIPNVLVDNPKILSARALSANQIQIGGLQPGVTRLSLWDEDGELHTIRVTVSRDGAELQGLLEVEFPRSSIRVRPLESSVVLSGWVDDPENIQNIVSMAEDFYPKVINNVRVGNNHQVMLYVSVMEVSRAKLRRLGVDWASFGDNDFVAQSVSGLIQETTTNAQAVVGSGGSTVTFGTAGSSSDFFSVIDALRQRDVVKILAEPTLTTISGRAAAFSAGGEFPILVPQGLGSLGIEYKAYGTRVDFVPIVLGNGNIRLEVRPEISEIDNARGVDLNGVRVPGLRTRWVDTAVEMRAGQTLALAGLIQEKSEASNRGLPKLADIPVAGALFRRVFADTSDIELLVMVRPEFVDAMDPDQVPLFGPGQHSRLPNDEQLFHNGTIEVPNCGYPSAGCFQQQTIDSPILNSSQPMPVPAASTIEVPDMHQQPFVAPVPDSAPSGQQARMSRLDEYVTPVSYQE